MPGRSEIGLPDILRADGLFPLSRARYTLLRVLTGILTAGAYLLLNRLFPVSTAVMAGAPLSFAPTAGSPAACAALLLLSFFFLLSCRGTSNTEFTFRGWKSGG